MLWKNLESELISVSYNAVRCPQLWTCILCRPTRVMRCRGNWTLTSPDQEVRSTCLCWPTRCCRRCRRAAAGTAHKQNTHRTSKTQTTKTITCYNNIHFILRSLLLCPYSLCLLNWTYNIMLLHVSQRSFLLMRGEWIVFICNVLLSIMTWDIFVLLIM